jgi:hypothetical protein
MPDISRSTLGDVLYVLKGRYFTEGRMMAVVLCAPRVKNTVNQLTGRLVAMLFHLTVSSGVYENVASKFVLTDFN